MRAGKVFYVTSQLDRGGTETQLLRMLRSFGPDDPSPILYSLTPDGRLSGEFREAGIPRDKGDASQLTKEFSAALPLPPQTLIHHVVR